ncbi:hypothetical protein L9F63_009103 [Diploptera punctata]|uniref:DNA replication complex GINS protein SLD5 n=1 Tax=Diploptera punctata TaxID=6984 RepID=A0AAD8E1R7_DIPPU|nr:hypothetical protein L9F63_009103 [Diploptera punctata]
MDNDNDLSFGLSDEEPISAQKVLKTLEEVWLNEKLSPELLKHQTEVVDCMLDQVQQMEENVSKLRKNDFRVVVHRMELERIRYIVASYLRTRLDKIEMFTNKILDDEDKREPEEKYLSPKEFKFAREYSSLMESHLQALALKHMPTYVQKFDKSKMSIVPNISSHVFLRAKRNITGIIIEGDNETGDEEIDLEENSQHIIQYKCIDRYLKAETVQLI